MKSFSIITPVYNGQEYIAKCIEAIAHANYDLSKIEHIVVDDGSTDDTRKICTELAKKYSHLKFYSKSNGNWGSVINYVRSNHMIHNEYVAVCDADDILLPKSFEIVNKYCKDVDLFASSFYRWNGKKFKYKIFPYFFLFKRFMHKKTNWNYHTSLLVPQSAWIKKEIFYKTIVLKENIAYQDTVFYTSAFLLSSNIRYTTRGTCLYWCRRPGNSMTQSNEDAGLAKMIANFSLYSDKNWLNPFVYYVMGYKKIRKYLKRHNLKFSFSKMKPDFSGMPFYIRPAMHLLFLILVKRFIE